MFDKLVDFGKQLFALKGQVEKNASDIKELRSDFKELTACVANLSQSHQELKILFQHLKETEASERDKLEREWTVYQERYEKDQEIVFLKLKNLIQEERIDRLSERGGNLRLSEGDDLNP
jgi:chromosome segregation ATPase